jgi:hypothetical protein
VSTQTNNWLDVRLTLGCGECLDARRAAAPSDRTLPVRKQTVCQESQTQPGLLDAEIFLATAIGAFFRHSQRARCGLAKCGPLLPRGA